MTSFKRKSKYFEIHMCSMAFERSIRYCPLDLPHLYNTVPAASDPPGQPGQFRAWLYSSPTIWFVHPIIPWSRCPAVLRCLRTKDVWEQKNLWCKQYQPYEQFLLLMAARYLLFIFEEYLFLWILMKNFFWGQFQLYFRHCIWKRKMFSLQLMLEKMWYCMYEWQT